MMGRQNGQMSMVILDIVELIPENHLLRKINRMVSLDFIYALVAPHYPANGRPSVDPVSMFKMLLVGYLYGIKSERRLVQEIQLNIAYRWFCGFEFGEKMKVIFLDIDSILRQTRKVIRILNHPRSELLWAVADLPNRKRKTLNSLQMHAILPKYSRQSHSQPVQRFPSPI